jgi:hypothetical protein
MPNYKIEGDIDFYSSLYSSLDYDSDKDKEIEEKEQLCEITGSKLTNNFVTLECNHKFNYDALYTEICKQKFTFQSYTHDVLSKKDIQKIRDSKLDYYIKCPYCRHVQFTLLPYYEDLPFQKKYGVNTNDPDYRVIKTASLNPNYLPSNYNFCVYGYQFSKGTCCKMNLINGKSVPCYNLYTTSVVAPDGSTKEFCTNHVRAEVKAFKLEVKKKAIEDKLKAKVEAKQKALADKAAAKEEKALKAKEAKEAKKNQPKEPKDKNEPKETKDENNTICVPCIAILKTGSRKGEACGLKSFENSLCKRHSK